MKAAPPTSRVLLVEDEEGHAELARVAFERTPELSLIVAGSLAEARRVLAASPPPDLVISDLQLPDGRGIELVPPDPHTAQYPVLITTSHGDESVAVEAMKAGALDYFVKSAETLADLPRFAARALREWNLVLERRKTQQQLQERERQLDHAHRMESIGRLASGVAHDFNNLLMGIIGCAELALARLDTNEAARRYIEELKKAAHGGSSIARSLLTFGRRGTSERVVADVDEAVKGIRHLVRSLAGDQVALDVQLGAGGACVTCGAGEIEQVVLNLAINSRDAMPLGGKLTIATRTQRVEKGNHEGFAPGEYVVLTITDTGVGMDEETLERAFEPFFTTKAPGKGTGLGLSMVYGAVKSAGGHVTVDSNPGEGTRVSLRLPRTFAPPTATSAAALGLASHPRPSTVLLIEDDARVRMLARHYLELEGHRVLEAADAVEARAVWAETGAEVGLLLSDVALPGVSGPEVAYELRRARPGLPVLFMSAHAAVSLAREHRLPEGAPLLTKPFSREELSARIAPLLAAAQAPLAIGAPQSAVARHATVLLVEDNAVARLAATELLADEGFRVLDAASGEEAMRLWNLDPAAVEVVVSDLALPDSSGGKLVEALREQRPGLPAIYISGRRPDDPELARLLEAEHSRFLSKPVDFGQLAALIRVLASAGAPAGS